MFDVAEAVINFAGTLETLGSYVATVASSFQYLGRALDLVAAGIAIIERDKGAAGILLAEAEGADKAADAYSGTIARME